jgi:hypothetical protein
VTFTKSGKGIYYRAGSFSGAADAKRIAPWRGLSKSTGFRPHRDGQDRLYFPSGIPVDIDGDVREEYWREIRKKPELIFDVLVVDHVNRARVDN